MKKAIYSLLLLAAATMGMTSCNSWIDEDPEGLITPDKVGSDETAVNQWVTGTYSKWIDDIFRWGYWPRVLELDNDYISGPDWCMSSLGAGNFQGDVDVVDALWNGCYGLIQRANEAQREIEKMDGLNEAFKNNAIGELKFNKAFAYFLLVRAYGAIPIQDEQEGGEQSKPRTSVDSVYHYIISNLEDAAQMMYKNTDSSYKTGHANAGSAAGLLAKVYATAASSAMPEGTEVTVRTGQAYTGSGSSKAYAPLRSMTFHKQAVSGYENLDSHALYTEAARWAKAVIDGQYGDYALLPYNQLWEKANANASEFMFSVGSVSGNDTYKNAIHTYYEGYQTAPGSDFIQDGGWIGNTRHWYDLFDRQDYRITAGVKHRWRVHTQQESNTGFYYPYDEEYCDSATGYNLAGQQVGQPRGIYGDGVSYYYSMDSQCLAFTTKYADVTNDAIQNADVNWPFLRYADVILIYAEAENELGNGEEAVTYLNQIRARSNANWAYLSGNGAVDTQVKRRSAIIEERAKEFACEADRRWDLIRWGIYLDAMNAVVSDDAGISKTRSSRNLLYPIPADEINTNKNIHGNNPGWN